MKVALTTLGCKVNHYETEAMRELFVQDGWEIAAFSEAADVYVINTCTVTQTSDTKSRQMIARAHRMNPDALVVAVGCYAQTAPEAVAALEGVGLVIGTSGRKEIVPRVKEALLAKAGEAFIAPLYEMRAFEPLSAVRDSRTRATLKIQDGCVNFCSYCIIPYARGPLRSRPPEEISSEVALLSAEGYREIVLTGIHLGAYGRDLAENVTLADAARAVLTLPELKRLRLGSLESIELSPELFALIRSDERFAKHLHLPLQAGSDAILKAMNRHYDTAEFARLIETVEDAVPGVAISTDIIVGFPGETEELFQQSLDFAARMNFARMHVFPYSRRKGTPAASMPDQVAPEVKKDRVHRMQQLADQKAAEFHAAFLGRTVDVLFETAHEGVWDGLTGNYIRVYTDAPVTGGSISRVCLERLYRDGIWGRLA